MELTPHFLIVTYPAQGHVNPARHLAQRLLRTTGAAVTFSTAISAHRRMFPSAAKPDEEVVDGSITYIPYSDSYDEGFNHDRDNHGDFLSRTKASGSKTLSSVIQSLADRDRPVTCVVYTLLLSWVGEVARELGIPSALYWIQPATVFAIYYHYFHGYDSVIMANAQDPLSTLQLPGMPSFKLRDLPSFLTITNPEDPYIAVLSLFRELFDKLDRDPRPRILMNTYDALEVDAITAVRKFELIAIGPVVPFLDASGLCKLDTESSTDLFKAEEKCYMDWLDSKPEKSVVYVSFGSLSVIKKRQMEEILWGLKESGLPYLWVVRKDNRGEGAELLERESGGEKGTIVEWCNQVKVLSHQAVGCFVTHCGWNSTLESLACGVPTVGVPQWTDQGTNAWLMVERGMGVRGELDGEGVLEGKELVRCLETVMGEGETSIEIRRKAEMWRDKAREAVSEGGSSDRNLRAFVEEIKAHIRE